MEPEQSVEQQQEAPQAPFVPEKSEKSHKTRPTNIKMARSTDSNFEGKTKAHLMTQKKVKIQIPATESDRTDVFVCVNGVTFQIRRDTPVLVPEALLEVLNNAKMTVFDQRKREDGEGIDMMPRQVMRFPYIVVTT